MTARIEDYKGRRVHFVGIGGSSMSGLAGLLASQGYIVTGSDKVASHKTERLEKSGIKIHIGHAAENVDGADALIYSAAIRSDNPERARAEELGICQLERCELIGQLMEGKKFAVGVSGTHGKTTATAMLAQAFMSAGADPTIHIGGELDFIGGSTRAGNSDSFICEACEFNGSFLKFHPTVAVILNIDEDHLDYYKNIENIERAFGRFAALTPEDGVIIGWGDDARVKRVMENSARRCISYGEGAENDLAPRALTYDKRGRAAYTAVMNGEKLCDVRLSVSGRGNMLDSLAAIAVAQLRGLDMKTVSEALNGFTGAHRRFELTSVTDGVSVYTDYGHNPAEIKNAIDIARHAPHREHWVVWQPHTYSRTKDLFNGFVETFDGVDHLLITDICASRESDPGDISSDMLIAPIRARGVDAVLTPTFDDAEAYLRENWVCGDIVTTHGCGDIDLLNEQIANHGDTRKELNK